MKKVPAFFIMFGLILHSCLNALAQEQTTKVPDDGWWVRYHTVRKNQKRADGQIQEFTNNKTFSLVGTVVEEGETCRWIETTLVRGKETVVVKKFLVPEKNLLKHEYSLEAFKRGWLKVEKREVRALDPGQEIDSVEPQLMYLHSTWQEADRVDTPRVVEYQNGRLTIPQALTLKMTRPDIISRRRNGIPEKRERVIEQFGWFDQKTAPVFAAAKINTKLYVNEVLETTSEEELTIEEVESDAKSQLPDNN